MIWQYMLVIVLVCVNTEGRDLTTEQRQARAGFVQRIINRFRNREGDVRLVGGRTQYEGNVYIRHAGRWGAVCDDSWGIEEAMLVCRSYNRTGTPTHNAHFGLASTKYWMDDVVCEGTEFSLNQCQLSGWGISDCQPNEAAGVICDKQLENNILKASAMVLPKKSLRSGLKGKLRIRLAGGRDVSEGRVEIYHNGEWGSICADGWSLYEALVVCKHLGFGFAHTASQSEDFGSSKVILSGVQCYGNETRFGHCKHDRIGNVACPGNKGTVAGAVCTTRLADLALDHRELEQTAHLQDVPLYQLQCAMEEMCLTESAYEVQRTNANWQLETRRLLRFTAAAINIGNDDFRPIVPKHLWQWHLCHMHYHSMEVFATFDVLDQQGDRVAKGHKASFCLEDNTCPEGIEKKYSCKNYGDQGISVNCTDIYRFNIDCQWVDVTDLEPGYYRLRVAVNPHAKVAEQSYHNNAALCSLLYTEQRASVYDCRLQRP